MESKGVEQTCVVEGEQMEGWQIEESGVHSRAVVVWKRLKVGEARSVGGCS